jgi:hypothetical protein
LSFQQPITIKDLAGMPIDEKRKAVLLFMSLISEIDVTVLNEVQLRVAVEIARRRGLGEPDLRADPSSNPEDCPGSPGRSSTFREG